MRLRLVLLVSLVVCLSSVEARHKMKGGKLHHRQKRTIGDIINWKLNLLQSIFGGITGLFGGGKKPGGRPRPGYGRPTRPARPSYGGNTQRPQRPSYGGGGGGGRPQGRPQGRPRPNYGGQGGGQQQQAQGGSQVFGPASVFHMLPAPNLATEAPQGATGDPGLGGVGLDTYGAPAAAPTSQAETSYRQPKFQPIRAPATSGDSYGAPVGNPVAAPASGDDYGSPVAPASTSYTGSTASSAPTSYSGAAAAPASDSYGGALAPVVVAAAPASDSYGGAVAPVVTLPPAPALDTYGGAQAPLLDPLPAPIIQDNSVLAEYDDYDPNDVPADQAAPESLDTYGAGLDTFARAEPVITDNSQQDSYGQPVEAFGAPVLTDAPVVVTSSDNLSESEAFGVPVPVGTSAPVPDDAFTVDSEAPTSFDSYTTNSLTESVATEGEITDLTQKYVESDEVSTQALEEETVGSTFAAEVVDLRESDEEASVLPPVADLTDVDYNKVNDITIELINEEAVESATPTSAPVLFTYAPGTEGPEFEDLEVPVNTIVLQSDDEGASLSDPLNVIPDEYEYDSYDEYDPNDIPPDQARPEELTTYVSEEQPTYSSSPREDEVPESQNEVGEEEEYIPFDANLRDVVEFSTIGPVPEDIAITTYSPEIDFDLGTTSAEGIEVVNVVTAVEEDPAEYLDDVLAGSNDVERAQPLYDDEYEDEEITSYQPENVDIPIVVEESQGVTVDLPSYDPVVLLVGTPDQGDKSARLQATHIPLFSEEELEEKKAAKRNAKKGKNKKKKSGLKERYNNWFGTRNDWSKRIQRVQGRIRFKHSKQRSS